MYDHFPGFTEWRPSLKLKWLTRRPLFYQKPSENIKVAKSGVYLQWRTNGYGLSLYLTYTLLQYFYIIKYLLRPIYGAR